MAGSELSEQIVHHDRQLAFAQRTGNGISIASHAGIPIQPTETLIVEPLCNGLRHLIEFA